ncbi:zinc finger MYM-type protein 1-like, partial [Aphis craccivora]
TTPVSKYHQTISLDYLTAHQLLKSLEKQLSNMAIDSISTFDNIFKAALSFASSVNDILTKNEIELEIETILSQKRSRKVKRMFDETATDESVSAFENDKHKFRVSVYQVVIDTASRQISVRFGALQCLAKMSNVERDGLVDQLISFASIYHNISNNTEYQSNVTDSENDEEETLTRCSIDQNCQKCIPCAIKLLKDFNLHSSAYSDLYIAYETLLTISFTQVSCERCFSKLKIIKTHLRSLIGQDLLESLILINSEADIIS